MKWLEWSMVISWPGSFCIFFCSISKGSWECTSALWLEKRVKIDWDNVLCWPLCPPDSCWSGDRVLDLFKPQWSSWYNLSPNFPWSFYLSLNPRCRRLACPFIQHSTCSSSRADLHGQTVSLSFQKRSHLFAAATCRAKYSYAPPAAFLHYLPAAMSCKCPSEKMSSLCFFFLSSPRQKHLAFGRWCRALKDYTRHSGLL